MKKFDFSVEVCLGFHCSGQGEYAVGNGTVELEDTQVNRLVSLIRESGGETDVEKLSLEERFPDVYEALDGACWEAASEACHRHWVLNGYYCGYFEEKDGLMESLEEAGVFKYSPESPMEDGEEVDEDAKEEAFREWFDGWFDSLSEDEQVSFIEDNYDGLEDDGDPGMYDYDVVIPQGIIDLAGGAAK